MKKLIILIVSMITILIVVNINYAIQATSKVKVYRRSLAGGQGVGGYYSYYKYQGKTEPQFVISW